RLGVERVAILHDEARRDLSPEAGLRAPLPLDLLEQSARRFVGRLALEHRSQIHDGLRRVVAAVVEMGKQQPDLRIVLRPRGAAELLARARKLAGTVQADGFLGERLSIAGTEGGEHDGSLRGAPLVATAFAPAEQQRRGAEQQRGEGEQADVRDERHARAQRAGSIRNRDWPNSTGCAFSTKILTTRPATLDSIS